jgi:hypothetical protein
MQWELKTTIGSDQLPRGIKSMGAVINMVVVSLKLSGRDDGGPLKHASKLMENNDDRAVIVGNGVGATSNNGNLGKTVLVNTFDVHKAIGRCCNHATIATSKSSISTTVNERTSAWACRGRTSNRVSASGVYFTGGNVVLRRNVCCGSAARSREQTANIARVMSSHHGKEVSALGNQWFRWWTVIHGCLSSLCSHEDTVVDRRKASNGALGCTIMVCT